MSEVLCIGLDIAWFGGSKNNKDSQFDCLVSSIYNPKAGTIKFNEPKRVKLAPERDPDAEILSKSIDDLLKEHSSCQKVIFAIDAPLQATERHELEPRKAKITKGSVERRACENYLSEQRKSIDKDQKDITDWMFRIQPGAPLAPRVKNLLTFLESVGFSLWNQDNSNSERLIIECFPAEVIWFIKRFGGYKTKGGTNVKSYKKIKEKYIKEEKEVETLVHTVLDDIAPFTGVPNLWNEIVSKTIEWMLEDEDWKSDKGFRTGKLLDDVIDSYLCLATAVGYSNNNFHVWQNPKCTSDGHIIGLGKLNPIEENGSE